MSESESGAESIRQPAADDVAPGGANPDQKSGHEVHPAEPEQTDTGFDQGVRETPRDPVVGRFDDGESLDPEEPEKERRGRFDDGVATTEHGSEGEFDEGHPGHVDRDDAPGR